MTHAARFLALAALLAGAPLARAGEPPPTPVPPRPPMAPVPPTPPAQSPEQAAEIARLRAELAEAKVKIDALRAERDAATIAGWEKKAADLSSAVAAMEKRIVDIKTSLHALPGAGPSGPGAEDARVRARHAELIAALRRASVEANEAQARGDDAAVAVALEKVEDLKERLAAAGKAPGGFDVSGSKAPGPKPAAVDWAAVKARHADLTAALDVAHRDVKEAEGRGDAEAAAKARARAEEAEQKLAALKERLARVQAGGEKGPGPRGPGGDEAMANAKIRHAEVAAALDRARAECKEAAARGDAEGEVAARRRLAEAELQMAHLKERLARAQGGDPMLQGGDDPRMRAAKVELGRALEQARKARADAKARGDMAAAEEWARKIADIEAKAAHLAGRPGKGAPGMPGMPMKPGAPDQRDAETAHLVQTKVVLRTTLDEARAAVKDAESRGDAAAAETARKRVADLERHLALVKEALAARNAAPQVPGAMPDRHGMDADAMRMKQVHAELQRALDEARAARKAADAAGDAAGAEAARRRIAELEVHAAKLKEQRNAHGEVLDRVEFGGARLRIRWPDEARAGEASRRDGDPIPHHPPGMDGPRGPKSEALMRASRILREAGMPDRADQLQRDAMNVAREENEAREGGGGGGGREDKVGPRRGGPGPGGLEEQVAELRNEVRRLRELVERMAK